MVGLDMDVDALLGRASVGDSDPFVARVLAQEDLYFLEILPRCIDAFMRGRGYRLIAEMMNRHDEGPGAIRALLELPTPSKAAREKALRARAQCPLRIVQFSEVDRFFSAGLLGEFRQSTTYIEGEMYWSYRQGAERWHVYIFQDGFINAGFVDDEVDDQILLTIFHEYIHYFEWFLPDGERPLADRENSGRVERYSVAQAIALDQAFVRQRARRWILLFMLILIPTSLVGYAHMPKWNLGRTKRRLQAHHQQVKAHLRRLEGLAARRSELEQTRRDLLSEIETRARYDSSYDIHKLDRALESAAGRTGGIKIDDTLVTKGRSQSNLLALIHTLTSTFGSVNLSAMNYRNGYWTLALDRMPGRAAPRPPRFPMKLRAKRSFFARIRHGDLQAQIDDDWARIEALRRDLGPLETIEAWRDSRRGPVGKHQMFHYGFLAAGWLEARPEDADFSLALDDSGTIVELTTRCRMQNDEVDRVYARMSETARSQGWTPVGTVRVLRSERRQGVRLGFARPGRGRAMTLY